MARPSRTRRILKWSGVGLSLFMLAAWPASLWWQVIITSEFVYVANWHDDILIITTDGDLGWLMPFDVELNRQEFEPPVFFLPVFEYRRPQAGKFLSKVELPFWFPLLLTAIPTAWLWHRDRGRMRPGHCPGCGYDLTGNTSGVCPECGDKACPPAVLADSECGKATPPLI